MSFAAKVWRLLVGIKDALALLFLLLFFMLLFAVLSARPNPGMVRDGALLLHLDGVVVEEVSPIDPFSALLSQSLPTREYAARDLVLAIDEAAKDKRIKAIALDLTTFLGGGQVHMQEVGAALARFRAAKKPILSYAVAYSDDAMMLASHASEVWVDPMGGVALQGPGGSRLYYADALKRFGVKANVYRVGTYKSAVEPYLLSEMSDDARENAQAIYGALWEEWLANVKQARPKADLVRASQDLPALIAENGGDLARASIAAGLVDEAGTYTEWGERVAEIAGSDAWDDAPGAFAHTALDVWLADVRPGASKSGMFSASTKPIGVITIAGEISDGEAGPGSAGAARITRLLDDALDDDLAALVVRVDSPGGTVTGSEAIRRAILRHKAKGIPIVVSMGNYAASGGYWVATPADRIFAEPETLTGSIGVFAILPSFEGLLADYGVNTDGVRTTPLSGQPDVFGGFTPQTEALLQANTESTYDRFLGLVAGARKITEERADELGQGRVWPGGTARQLGLVDQFGGLNTAAEWAAGQAKLKDGEWQLRFLGAEEASYSPLIAQLLGGSEDRAAGPARGTDMVALLARQDQQLTARLMADFERLFSAPGMQARCLECMAAQPIARPIALPAVPSFGAGGSKLFRIMQTLLGD